MISDKELTTEMMKIIESDERLRTARRICHDLLGFILHLINPILKQRGFPECVVIGISVFIPNKDTKKSDEVIVQGPSTIQ
jgi:hypothetical protein